MSTQLEALERASGAVFAPFTDRVLPARFTACGRICALCADGPRHLYPVVHVFAEIVARLRDKLVRFHHSSRPYHSGLTIATRRGR